VDVLGALLFVVAIVASVVLHEAGHMVCARMAGGKVTEFFVGFGQRLWSFRRGETEYGLKAIPVGGYVKIVGMTDLDEVPPGDEGRALKDKPARWRLLTLSAGSLTHFLIAFVLFYLLAVAFGATQADNTPTIGTVAACMSTQGSTTGCDAATQPSPAAKAGLKAGDVITSVNGKAVTTYAQMTDTLHRLPADKPAKVGYTAPDGTKHTTTVVPIHAAQVTFSNGSTGAGSLIGLTGATTTTHYNPITGFGNAGSQFGSAMVETFQGLGSIPSSIPQLFSSTVHHTQRSDDTPSSVVGAAQVAGSAYGTDGLQGLLIVIAVVNMFIGVFNLLPLLPLDGGHIAILAYEEVRKRIYRLVRRPDPGRVDLNKLMPVTYAVLLAFVALTVLLLAADITNPLRLPS
jgi:membrane-associated protease RseP (regulator of RpoE activity)